MDFGGLFTREDAGYCGSFIVEEGTWFVHVDDGWCPESYPIEVDAPSTTIELRFETCAP